MIQIFKNLDFRSLHSCALVNRYWCQVAIPVLWIEPFENIYKETVPLTESVKNLSLLVDTYIDSLPGESKLELTNAGIFGFYKEKCPSFDYPSFLQNLDIICL